MSIAPRSLRALAPCLSLAVVIGLALVTLAG